MGSSATVFGFILIIVQLCLITQGSGACVRDSDCPVYQACIENKCQNPCRVPCVVNAQCKPRNHIAICTCIFGYIGFPWSSCYPVVGGGNTGGKCTTHRVCPDYQACLEYKCQNPCQGQCEMNAQCNVRNHIADCTCTDEYIGNPWIGCYRYRRFRITPTRPTPPTSGY